MTAYPLVLADSATMLRRNLRRMRRYPSLTFFIAGIPVVFLLLFVYVLGGTLGAGLGGVAGGRAEYIAYVVPGILLITVAGAAQGTAISVAMDMTEGIIARFRTMAIARVVGPDRPRHRQRHPDDAGHRDRHGRRRADRVPPDHRVRIEWLAAAGLLALAAFAISWLSVALAWSAKSVETASNLPMFLVLLPFLSSGFVPTDSMPDGLSWFAENQPFTPMIETRARPAARHADRRQRHPRGRLVRRHLGRRLSLGAAAVRAQPGVVVLRFAVHRGTPTLGMPQPMW